MSTDDTSSDHGFFVRKGHDGPLHHAAGRNPRAALAAIDALHLCDGDRIWVWRAAPVRPDIENSSVGALGPVEDPRVFEVRIGLIELNEGFIDPEVMLEEMLAESERTSLPRYPRAPNISSCVYDAARHVFVVMFENERTETLFGSRVKREDGTPVPPGAVRRCEPDEFRRGVLVKLGDGSETSFSADLVLYETDPDFRAWADAASRVPNASVQGIVHVLIGGTPLCGFMAGTVPGDWPQGHTWCYVEQAPEKSNCAMCLAKALTRVPAPEVTLSAQPDTSEGGAFARKRRVDAEMDRLQDMSDELLRSLVQATVRAVWEAVDVLDDVPEGADPPHVVRRHLRNGNIRKGAR